MDARVLRRAQERDGAAERVAEDPDTRMAGSASTSTGAGRSARSRKPSVITYPSLVPKERKATSRTVNREWSAPAMGRRSALFAGYPCSTTTAGRLRGGGDQPGGELHAISRRDREVFGRKAI